MAASGLIIINNKNKPTERPVMLYAFHDGYIDNAIETLVRLPFQIFQTSKILAGKRKFAYIGENQNGHRFYQTHANFPPTSREDFDDLWERNGANYPCYQDAVRLANQMVWAAFDFWNVIRNTEDMTYLKDRPLCIVTCDEDIGEYEIFVQCAKTDANSLAVRVREFIAPLNKPLPDTAKVTVTVNGGLSIYVPSTAIMKELTWKSVKSINKRIHKQPH